MGYNSFMTIHHDKLAYGKLQPTSEELSEEEILSLLKQKEKEQAGQAEKEAGNHEEKQVIN